MFCRLETGQSTYDVLPDPTVGSKWKPGSPPNSTGSTTVAGVNGTASAKLVTAAVVMENDAV